MDHRFPSPPEMDERKVRELVAYARSVVAYLKQEGHVAREHGHDVPQSSPLLEGWDFVATALAESYELDDLLD